MTAAAEVHPSVSRDPLPVNATDLKNVCVLCSHNCGLHMDVEQGKITAVRPDKEALSQGYVCNKAASVPLTVNHAQRVEYPLKRREDGSFEQISWEQAVSEIAAKLNEIRAESGGNAIGFVGGGGQANHLGTGYGLSLMAQLGSRRWYSAYAQEKHQHHLIDQWMFDAPPNTYFAADEEETPLLVAMGTNPRVSNRGPKPSVTFNELKRDEARKLIVVDPRVTETTASADLHVRVRPGADAFLLLGIAKTLIEEDLIDVDFIRDKTNGFDEIKAALDPVNVAVMADRCGLEEAQVREVAREIGNSPATSIMYDLAIEQTWFSTLNSYMIRLVLSLTGNVSRKGANFFREGFAPPVRSKSRFDEPERAVVSGIPAIRALGNFAMTSPSLVPEEALTDDPRRLRAIFVENANPWLAYSDTPKWREAAKKLDLVVVVEPAMTEAALEADYVLPAAVGYEKWEWAGFSKGHFPKIAVQLRPPVVPPPGEALPEPEIYDRLARAVEAFPEPPAELHDLARKALDPDGIDAYMEGLKAIKGPGRMFWAYRTLGPLLPSPGAAVLLLRCVDNGVRRPEAVVRALGEELRGSSAAQLGLAMFQQMLDHPEGVVVAIADRERNFEQHVGWEDGRVRLAPEAMLREIERALAFERPASPDFPLLLAGGLRTHWTANGIHRHPDWRKGKGPHCSLHISPRDAASLSIDDGQRVVVATNRGTLELPAEVDKRLLDGHVWIPNGFGAVYPDPETGEPVMQGVNINEITDAADRDPISGCPHHKAIPCRVAVA